ncbi:MAG: alpha,alpha-trehalose-phosphate synthase (UDP-forming) [Rhodobiaceae bacterium]|nr:alpha,alpha-trehalose-phosphate synthase (UDP-forming) [Rhodobiaceae bacterium]MCC0055213.1 alpha,alpha-trehalose-phosphate synthase (UDP-forming) [Rhodobiaceae bacterium]
MTRLVVVSNRVADLSKGSQSGGLAVAVGDALQERGGLWFGWDGNVTAQSRRLPANVHKDGPVTTVTLPLTQKDYKEYYLGFSNSMLWPILHYRLDLARFNKGDLKGYRRVNSKFADALRPFLKPDDVIWVHDYHLIPLAAELRQRGLPHKIGFFLHIPFPPPDVLAAAPEYEWLLRTLFSYDLVGFQTHADVANFERHVLAQGGEVMADGQVTAFGRTIMVRRFPIGIDVDAFAEMAVTREAREEIGRLKRHQPAGSHIIGVDRLDYSKGLPDRLRAFERLLELYPENHRRVSFLQVAPPTREDVEAYADIRLELEGLAGAINGRFGEYDWTPLQYIHRNVPRSTLAALFRGSQVGLVTPLRDGMNLVAKEFVAAQDEADPGALVLSRFAGAAEELQEALVVNPYDVDEVAAAMQTAITMPVEERRNRHAALLRRIRQYDAKSWQDDFLKVLDAVPTGPAA